MEFSNKNNLDQFLWLFCYFEFRLDFQDENLKIEHKWFYTQGDLPYNLKTKKY